MLNVELFAKTIAFELLSDKNDVSIYGGKVEWCLYDDFKQLGRRWSPISLDLSTFDLNSSFSTNITSSKLKPLLCLL